jgi:hypothetical protein
MVSVHIKDIQQYFKGKVDKKTDDSDGFIEIRFNELGYIPVSTNKESVYIDEEFKDRVFTVDCPYGTVTIVFDEYGQLRSIDMC